jgi:phenylacetate-CoA ligase
MEAAFITRAYRAHGTRLYGEKTLWMRSYAPPEGGPIHCYNPEIRRHYLSAFHLSASTVEEYKRIIDKSGCRCLSTYPSSAYALAMLLDKAGLRLKRIQVVHVASEQLLPQWIPLIERVIGPVYDHYGMMEKVAFFHRCPLSGGLYHESLEYGVTEIVDGEVVGTGLWNFAMPLIRYRTGDLAEPNDGEQRCACGRGLPLTVKAFAGRSDDILVTPDGRYIPSVNFYTMMYKTPGVGMFQIVQDLPDHVTVLIVPSKEFVPTTLTRVAEGLRQRLGDGVAVTVRAVNDIKRDERTGKVRCVQRTSALTSTA